MTDKPEPTFLCRAWAAFRLLQEGRTEAAENELAAAFGRTIQRIKRDGRLLAKIELRDDLTPEQEIAAYQQMADIVGAMREAKP